MNKPPPKGPYPILLNAGPSRAGWHAVATWMACPQLYAYEKVLKIALPASDPLVKGSLVHVGLAHLYARRVCAEMGWDAGTFVDPYTAIKRVAASEADARPGPWLAHVDLCSETVQRYDAHTLTETIDWKIRGIEVELIATIEGVGEYTQRIDLIIEHRKTGVIKYVDHKSTSTRLSNPTKDRGYFMSGQFHGMHYFGTQRHGDKFDGCAINYVQLGTGERKVSNVPPAEWAWERFPGNVQRARREIAEAHERGDDPWLYPQRMSDTICEHRYGPCEAASLCLHGRAALKTLGAPTTRERRNG